MANLQLLLYIKIALLADKLHVSSKDNRNILYIEN